MKKKDKKKANNPRGMFSNPLRSFTTRVSVVAAVIAGLIFAATTLIVGIQSRHTMRQNLEAAAFSQLDYINLEIGSVMADVSNSVSSIAPLVERELCRPRPDSAMLNYLMEQIVGNDRKVRACTLGLEPDVMPGRPTYCLYVTGKPGPLVSRQMASDDFFYPSMDWYVIPKLTQGDYWTDPYVNHFLDDGAIVVTYAYPLRDERDSLIGILSADVSVSYFTRYLKENSQYEDSYNIMIGVDASFIVHPDVNNILSNTIFSLHHDDEDSTWEEIGNEMIADHVGKAELRENGKRWMVFYAPIKGIGWSAATVCSYNDIFAPSMTQTRIFILIGIFAILLLYFIVRAVVKRISHPVVKMAQAARMVAEGDFRAPLPEVTTDDELRDLHDSLELMQNSLSAFMGQIQHNAAVQQRIDSEMDMARNIQLGMLPQFSDAIMSNEHFDLHAVLRPARMVGGDLYDFYLEGKNLFFVVADVSGKGFPASLLMVEARSMLRSIVATVSSPSQVLAYLNNAIIETNKASMFVTMFIGVLDIETGHLVYSNAGHNPPLILHNDTTVTELDVDPNLPLGSIDNQEYSEQETYLKPGELIYVYTDGVSEAENTAHELFGIDNIVRTLALCTTADARRTIDAVDSEMRDHVGNAAQADDITSLAIRYHHPVEAPKPFYSQISLTTFDDLPRLTALLEELQSRYGLTDEMVLSLNLALEEVAVNIIQYSHPNDPIKHPFEMSVRVANREIDFTFTDTGVPFDPTQPPEVDIDLPIEERTIGGLGIHLTRQIMDYMAYLRHNKRNVLRMKKKF